MKYFDMEAWASLCRCCLSPDSDVSLLDTEQNVHDKFHEITTLEVGSVPQTAVIGVNQQIITTTKIHHS